MNETWSWLITVAAWVFLIGTSMVALSVFPGISRRRPRLMMEGFLLALTSFVLVFLAWGLPRLPF